MVVSTRNHGSVAVAKRALRHIPTAITSQRDWRVPKQPRTGRHGGYMALLIVELDKHIGNPKAWRDTFKEQLPDMEIRIWPDAGKLEDIEYLAFMHPNFDSLPNFPNLKAI